MTMLIFALEEIGRNARNLANYASVAGWIIKNVIIYRLELYSNIKEIKL